MKVQVIQDGEGKNAGVFIPIEDWTTIKTNYPDIDTLENTIPEWQKQLVNERLDQIAKNPNNLKPIDELLDELDSAH